MLSSRQVGWSSLRDTSPRKDGRKGVVDQMRRVADLYPSSQLNHNLHGPSVGVLADGPGTRIRRALRLADKDELTAAEQLEWNEAAFLVFGNRMRGF